MSVKSSSLPAFVLFFFVFVDFKYTRKCAVLSHAKSFILCHYVTSGHVPLIKMQLIIIYFILLAHQPSLPPLEFLFFFLVINTSTQLFSSRIISFFLLACLPSQLLFQLSRVWQPFSLKLKLLQKLCRDFTFFYDCYEFSFYCFCCCCYLFV